jgi:hypothetical protein
MCCESAAGAALHVDTFATGVEGWAGGGVPTRIATGGAGDGGAYVNVSAASALATFNTSPQWTGDIAATGADRVRVDMMAPTTSAPLAMRLVLFGPFSTQERWTSTVPLTVPNDGVWRKFTFSLLAGEQ